MAWTYNSAELNTTTEAGRRNTVRLLVGDTDTLDQQVDDAEVLFSLAQSNNGVYFAASWIARAISSKYARRVTTEISGSLKAQYSDLMKHYSSLADKLDYQGKTSGAVVGILAGGVTKSKVNSVRQDTNRIEGSFRRDRFKNPPSYQTPEYE